MFICDEIKVKITLSAGLAIVLRQCWFWECELGYLRTCNIIDLIFGRICGCMLYFVSKYGLFFTIWNSLLGRVVNVISLLGRIAAPARSPFCSVKFGLEAFSDCLRLEMRRWGVDVVVVEPGVVTTGNFTVVIANQLIFCCDVTITLFKNFFCQYKLYVFFSLW